MASEQSGAQALRPGKGWLRTKASSRDHVSWGKPSAVAAETPLRAQIARLPLFCELEPKEVDRVADAARLLRVKRHTVIFHRGQVLDRFYYVVEGIVKLTINSPDGYEKVVDLEQPGMSFGEALIFLDRPSPVAAQAIEATTLLEISKSVVLDIVDGSPAFARRLLAGLSRRLHLLVSDLESYCLQSATQRVIGLLLSEVPGDANSEIGPVEVTLPASKTVVASRLHLSPETFSRVLRNLADEQCIAVDGKTIAIRDLQRLRRCVGAS